jgi:ribonucleotide monophosphatase NagD (HAD superfamily)
MDGVLTYEELAIPGADRFLAHLHDLEISCLVLTKLDRPRGRVFA